MSFFLKEKNIRCDNMATLLTFTFDVVFSLGTVAIVQVNRKLSQFTKEQYPEATADLTTAEIETRPVPTSLILVFTVRLYFKIPIYFIFSIAAFTLWRAGCVLGRS